MKRADVYGRACDLIKVVLELVKILPREKKYTLGDQMRRAIVSVKLNILEGSSKRTCREFLNYLLLSSTYSNVPPPCIKVYSETR